MKTTLLPGTIQFNTSITDQSQKVRNLAGKVIINQHPAESNRNRTKWHSVRSIILFVMILLLSAPVLQAVTYYSRASGDWNSNTTWSTTGYLGSSAGAFPVAGDDVYIGNNYTVTLTVNAACTSITFDGSLSNDDNTVLINSGITLTVSGAINIPRSNSTGHLNTITVGAGILNAGSIAFTSAGGSVRHSITISTGTVTVSGDVTGSSVTGDNSPTISFSGAGFLKLGGSLFASTYGTLTTFAGSTVEYNGAAQTVQNFVYRNLTISGSGIKTLTGISDVRTTLTVNAGCTLVLSTFNLGTPTSLVMQCGSAAAGSSITGTGLLTLGGDLTVNNVATGTNGATISCPVALGSTRTFNVANDGTAATDLTISSIISGINVGITKAGTGTMVLSGANTYSGATTISNGTLSAASIVVSGGVSNLGNTISAVVLGGASTSGILSYTGSAASYTRGFTVSAGGGGITNTTANLLTINTGGIVNSGPLTLSNTGSGGTTFSSTSIISGTGSVTVNNSGTGVTTLTGANTYTGLTTINAGTLKLGAAGSGLNSPLGTTASGTLVNSGGVLDLGGFALATAEPLTLNGTGISSGGALINSSSTVVSYNGALTLASASSIGTPSGRITLGGGISGGMDLTKVGFGTLNLGSGTTTLNSLTINTSGGTLDAGSGTVYVAGNFSNNGTFTASTSTVNFNGAIQTISGTNSTTFNNLIFSGSGTKTFSLSTTISGNLSILSPVVANLGTGSHSANALSLGGNNQPSGTYGGTSSGANYIIPAYFADVSGILNVATGSCTAGYWLGNTSSDWNTASNWCGGTIPGSVTNVTILSGTPYQPVISSAAVCNDITINSLATLAISGTNTLTVGGTWTNTGTFTAGTGTVIFNGASQTITGSTTFYNVTVSGTGSKTITTANFIINSVLSMEGPVAATLSLAPTYGAAATLQYNTATARTAGVEWLPTFIATGGVIINTGTITLNNAKTLGSSTNVPLNIKTGATLSTSGTNYGLTFHGDFINKGALSAGSSAIIITGITDPQNIDGFTTTGTVSMTKTGGSTATLHGNINGAGLIINGNTGTLNLGTSLTHVFTGALTRTSGTLNGGSSLLKIGGSVSGTGGTFTAGTGTVEWYATGNQTLAGVTYNNLILSGSGIKTTTSVTINGILSMEGTATASTLPTYGGSATLQYKGSLAQTTGPEFPSTWSGTGGVKIENANGVTLTGAKDIGITSLTIGGSVLNSVFNDGGYQLTSAGTLNLTSGTFKLGATAATAFPAFGTINILAGTTVEYAANAAQTVKGITYSNLTISGNSSKIADGNITVNGILNLISSNFSSIQGCLDMNTTPFILTMGASATTIGTGDVTGIVTRNSFVAGTYYTFGNRFTTLNMLDGGTLPSSVSFKIVLTASHPWKANAINRYYDIAQTGGTSDTKATLNLHYLSGELNGAVENNLDLFDFLVSNSTTTDELRSNSSLADRWVGLANLAIDYIAPSTGFGSKYWTLGTSTFANFTWIGGTSTDWTVGANWTGGNAPGPGDAVIIPDAASTINDPSLPASTTIGSINIHSGGILNATTGTPVLTISGGAGAWTNLGTLNAGSGTVVFTSPSATMAGITDFNNVTVNNGAALSVGTDNIMRIRGTLSLSATGILNASSNHNTVEYNGTNQTVINPIGSTSGYHNLTLSGSGIKTMPASAMNIAGDFATSGTSSATAGNALTVTGSVILGSGTTFDPSTFTHIISGNWTNNGATFSPAAGTITFNNTSSAQVINGSAANQTFYNLTVNKVAQTLSVDEGISLTVHNFTETSGNFSAPGTFTVNGNTTLTDGTFTGGATATISGNITLSGGTYVAGTNTNVLGDWTKNGTLFTPGSGTVFFNGTSAQTLAGTTSTIFNNLTVNNAAGVTASLDQTVNGILNLQSPNASEFKGSLDMGSNTLMMGAVATTTGTGDVTGKVKRGSFITGISYTFGNQFTRVSFLSVGTLPTTLTFKITIGTEPAWKPSLSPAINAILREYEVVNEGGANCYANVTMHYLDSELNGNNEDKMTKWRWAAGPPVTITDMRKSSNNSTENWIENISVPISLFPTSFDNVKISMANTIAPTNLWNGSVSSDWNDGFNWTPYGVPNQTSMVDIPDAATTDHSPNLPTGGVTIGTLQILAGGLLYSNNQPVTITGMTAAWIDNGGFNAGNTTGSVTFTGNGATIAGTTQFNDLVFDPGAFVTNSNSSVVRISGSVTNNGVWYTVIGNESTTVEYNGVNQTVIIPDPLTNRYSTLILSGSGTVTMPSQHLDILGDFITGGTVLVNAFQDLSVLGNVTINTGTTLNGSTFNHSVGGIWSNSGTFTAGTSTVTFNGTTAQTISGSSTFNNLTVTNTAGVNASADQTVNGILNLPVSNASATKGSLDMDGHYLNLGANATNTGTGDVTGFVRRTLTFELGHVYTFGNPYNSVLFQPGGSNYTGSLLWKISIGSVPEWKNDAIKREYEIVNTGSLSCLANITMHYLPTELNGNEEDEMVKWQWTSPSAITEMFRSNYSTSQQWIENDAVSINLLPSTTGLVKISMAISGNPTFTWTGALSTDWNNPGNWSAWPVTSTSAVSIPDASLTFFDPVLPSGGATVQTLSVENAGILNSNGEPLTITGSSGAWINYGTFNAGSGNVTFTGIDATLAGTTQFDNITIGSGARLTNLQNALIKITGTVTKTGGWAADADINTVEYNGTDQTIINPDVAPLGYHNLTLSGSGTKTMPAAAMSVHKNLTLTGAITPVVPGNSLSIGGDLNIGTGITFTAGSLAHSVGGNFINDGIFTGTGSTISLNGTADQSISGSTSTIFNNLALEGSGAKNLSASTEVNGNITMSGTATTTIVADLTIGGNLVIGAGNIFTVPATRNLTVSSNITNAGNSGLVIKSDVTGDGKLINNTSSAPATVELYLTGGLVSPGVGRFHYFVPPVQSMSIGTIPTVAETKTALGLTYFNGDLIRYLEPQAIDTKEQGWQYFHNYPGTPPGFTSLVSSIGYNIYLNGSSDIIKFKGDLNAGPHLFNLSYTPGNVGAGWNLVGNPYPCNYDLSGIGGLGTVVDGISNTIYFNNNGGYGYWNVLTGTGSSGNSNILPPMTGFFVKVSQPSMSLSLPVGSKTAGISDPRSAHKGASFSSEKGLAVQKVKLVLTSGSQSDETVALLFDDATNTFNEHYDAYKLFNTKSGSPDIYFELNGIDYFMKAVKAPVSEAVIIPLKVVLKEAGTHIINITEFENLDGINVTLKHGAIETKLSQNASYTFTSQAGTFTDFELIFGDLNSSTAIEEVTNENLRIWHNNDYLYVNFTGEIPSNTGRLIIYDFNGREVINNRNLSLVPKQTNQIPVKLQKGFYVADIVINSKNYRTKIVVY